MDFAVTGRMPVPLFSCDYDLVPQSKRFTLLFGRGAVAGKGRVVAAATDSAKDKCEAAAVAGWRAIRVGTVNRIAMMDHGIARSERNRLLERTIFVGEVDDSL